MLLQKITRCVFWIDYRIVAAVVVIIISVAQAIHPRRVSLAGTTSQRSQRRVRRRREQQRRRATETAHQVLGQVRGEALTATAREVHAVRRVQGVHRCGRVVTQRRAHPGQARLRQAVLRALRGQSLGRTLGLQGAAAQLLGLCLLLLLHPVLVHLDRLVKPAQLTASAKQGRFRLRQVHRPGANSHPKPSQGSAEVRAC